MGLWGREAKGIEFDKLIGKRIPEKYRDPGNANPVLYKSDSTAVWTMTGFRLWIAWGTVGIILRVPPKGNSTRG